MKSTTIKNEHETKENFLNIFILGLGHIGSALAQELVKNGHQLTGTTRSNKPNCSAQINHLSFQAELHTPMPDGLDQYDLVISTLTPFQDSKDFHLKFFKNCRPDARLVAFSSTGVFAEDQGEVDESSAALGSTARAVQLRDFENALISSFNNLTIVRPGGFLGPKRHPVKTLSAKEALYDGESLVNLIEESEVVRAMIFMIENQKWAPIVHLVSEDHPTKKEFYTREAKKWGLKAPNYLEGGPKMASPKIVRAQVLKQWGFHFSPL